MKGLALFEMPDELLEDFVSVMKWFMDRHEDCEVELFAETQSNAEALKQMFEKMGFPNITERKVH